MKPEDVKLYHLIQKNAHTAMNALDSMTERIYDKNLSVEASREFLTFSEIHNRAKKALQAEAEACYKPSQVQDVLHRSGLQMGTMLDTSTPHVADMLIQENSKGMTQICRNMHQYESASRDCIELAEELAIFEENNMDRLKRYL